VKVDRFENVEDFYDITDKRVKAGVRVINLESQNAKNQPHSADEASEERVGVQYSNCGREAHRSFAEVIFVHEADQVLW
jgi:hypothetical protein